MERFFRPPKCPRHVQRGQQKSVEAGCFNAF
jgi:hypothetical protein